MEWSVSPGTTSLFAGSPPLLEASPFTSIVWASVSSGLPSQEDGAVPPVLWQ